MILLYREIVAFLFFLNMSSCISFLKLAELIRNTADPIAGSMFRVCMRPPHENDLQAVLDEKLHKSAVSKHLWISEQTTDVFGEQQKEIEFELKRNVRELRIQRARNNAINCREIMDRIRLYRYMLQLIDHGRYQLMDHEMTCEFERVKDNVQASITKVAQTILHDLHDREKMQHIQQRNNALLAPDYNEIMEEMDHQNAESMHEHSQVIRDHRTNVYNSLQHFGDQVSLNMNNRQVLDDPQRIDMEDPIMRGDNWREQVDTFLAKMDNSSSVTEAFDFISPTITSLQNIEQDVFADSTSIREPPSLDILNSLMHGASSSSSTNMNNRNALMAEMLDQ